LDGVGYGTADRVSKTSVAERQAFDLAELRRYSEAADRLQQAVDGTADLRLRGWLKQQAAAYRHFVDPVAAQGMQESALTDNRALLKPKVNLHYVRLRATEAQANQAADYLDRLYPTSAEFLLGVATVVDDLVPASDPAAVARFEQATHDLGLHLGFSAQRPERDTGEGPDVLWLLGDLSFLVIECKSGVATDFISRHDIAQLSHSMDWFANNYDGTCKATPVLIHKVPVLHKSATARSGTRVITFSRLAELRSSIRRFADSLAQARRYSDASTLTERLATFDVNGRSFMNHWGVPTRKS
jgi:hypothetical protein